MEVKASVNGVTVRTEDCFDLTNTFECGQCFRWDRASDGSYTGIVGEKEVRVFAQDGSITIEHCTVQEFETIWLPYFDLSADYRQIRAELAERCPLLKPAVESIDGIRILRQDPWETLCSFILSQNNNIPRIRGIISRLCAAFGKKCGSGYTFPAAEVLAEKSVEELAPLRAGFRARYILDAARKVSSGQIDLYPLYTAPIDECRKELMQIVGVGAKVAECTLLYGLHRTEAFPADVWIKKALSSEFSGISVPSLGTYAGIAQQYIFHYMRTRSGR